ncbi:hypothetical protein PHLGIDRAFT_415233 [Phlebiopsis gigantea 11061_1 CR5-6]|uniref:Uncharacterized protein n=1 Tax=Phlebiopsis gigantea (strain 11061_1 CR5-6) TaxID=745531 RepID=A0A0C3S8J7_PHLG1|nr:hypothetical protein PHLGIDRAFT_415233 [Phlebiopsis gigantea 11061_1 CR5-6]
MQSMTSADASIQKSTENGWITSTVHNTRPSCPHRKIVPMLPQPTPTHTTTAAGTGTGTGTGTLRATILQARTRSTTTPLQRSTTRAPTCRSSRGGCAPRC